MNHRRHTSTCTHPPHLTSPKHGIPITNCSVSASKNDTSIHLPHPPSKFDKRRKEKDGPGDPCPGTRRRGGGGGPPGGGEGSGGTSWPDGGGSEEREGTAGGGRRRRWRRTSCHRLPQTWCPSPPPPPRPPRAAARRRRRPTPRLRRPSPSFPAADPPPPPRPLLSMGLGWVGGWVWARGGGGSRRRRRRRSSRSFNDGNLDRSRCPPLITSAFFLFFFLSFLSFSLLILL